MEVIIYTHIDNAQKDELVKKISQEIEPGPVMVFNFESLFKMLKTRVSGRFVIVFIISCDDELEVLIKKKSHLFNTPFVLVLTENDESMAQKGLSLQPRYLSYPGYDHDNIAKVLNKMRGKYGK